MDAFRDDQDVGLRTMAWGSSCALLPGFIDHMGQGGGSVVLAADTTRFSATSVMVVKLPPNTRLKLTAPVGYGRIPFVIIVARRRSLGAPR